MSQSSRIALGRRRSCQTVALSTLSVGEAQDGSICSITNTIGQPLNLRSRYAATRVNGSPGKACCEWQTDGRGAGGSGGVSGERHSQVLAETVAVRVTVRGADRVYVVSVSLGDAGDVPARFPGGQHRHDRGVL